MEKKVLRIIAVFLAGAKNKVLWLGKDASKHFYWVSWPLMKWFPFRIIRKILGFKIIRLDELRIESAKRLDRAIYIAKNYEYNEIFIPDSFSPKRKISIGQLAIDYLSTRGIPREKILTQGNAVGTANKANNLAMHIYTLIAREDNMQVILYLPVMDYYAKRLLNNIKREFNRLKIIKQVQIIESRIFPFEIFGLEECMRDEMRYNLLTEKLKLWTEKIPWLERFAEWLERRGRKK